MDQTFESIYELEKYLSRAMESSMHKIANEISNELREKYQTLWYDRDTGGRTYGDSSTIYKRTKQLKKGIEIKVNNSKNFFDYSIGFYGTKIEPTYDPSRFFSAYMSLDGSESYNGMHITEAIAYWIEKGTINKYYSMPAKHIFQIVAKDYNRVKVETKLKNLLMIQGLDFE